MSETNNTHNNSGPSRGSSTTWGYCENHGDSKADGPTLLELFMLAPEFEDFKKLLRKAAHVLTVADFVRLRKSYDAAWLNIIGEL
jgi:hypothetical protein